MNSFLKNGGVFIVLGLLILLYSQLPLGSALEFSSDEGFELMKGFLCSKGHGLYAEIWSDQPPVYTLLLKCVFEAAGPSILTARLVAAGFGLLLFSMFFELIRIRSGPISAAVAAFFLIASPAVLLLSVAVMKEVAAFSTALLSVWLLFRWTKGLHWGWLAASGVVMGLAVEIKFSALLVVPASLVEISLFGRGSKTKSGVETTKVNTRTQSSRDANATHVRHLAFWKSMLIWSVAVLAVAAIMGFGWSRGSLETSWKAHLTGHPVTGMQIREEIRFPVSLLANHAECVFAAIIGVVMLVWKRQWRALAFPAFLLVTAIAVHCVHRPWWDYYYLHFAIPMAWFAGIAVAETMKSIFKFFSETRIRSGHAATWKGLGLCALTAMALARSLSRFEAETKALRMRPRSETNPVISKMREFADRTKWVYSEDAIYPFHVRLSMPPELAVVTPKRFWSGQISTKQIIEVCERYQPEMIVLSVTGNQREWNNFLQSKYVAISTDKKCDLYIAKHLNNVSHPDRK